MPGGGVSASRSCVVDLRGGGAMARSGLAPHRRLACAVAPLAALVAALVATGALSPAAAVAAAILLAGGCWWFLSAPAPPPPSEARTPPPPPVAISQRLLDGLPDLVVVVDGQRRIVAANARARETLAITASGRDLALSLRHPEALLAADVALVGRSSVKDVISLPAAGSQAFTLHATSLADGNGQQGAVLVLRDETRARQAERSHADFVANASHELRSPLSALIGFIETLRGPATDDAAARERFLKLMHAEAMRMARLIDDLMSLTRVEIDEHVPPRDAVRLGDVLSITAETLGARAAAKQMPIEVDCPPEIPAVIGDEDQLIQVFLNLVDNAVKYGRPATAIRIQARMVDRHPEAGVAGVVVTVRDNGEGIGAEHLPRLTERFYRADAGRSRRLGGTGLGLAIVEHIINRHRGRLAIASELGIGTTVTVFLPCAAAADAPAPSAA